MKDQEQPAKNEERLLELLSKGLSTEFQNPSRAGCPDPAVLKALASHRIALSETEQWLDHFGSCSQCFIEFTAIRQRLRTRRQMKLGGVLAVVIAVCALWFNLQSHLVPVVATLDLRAYSVERGQDLTTKPFLDIRRGTKHLILYMPVGSKEGSYDLVLQDEAGDQFLHATGLAQLENQIVILRTDVNLSRVPRASYLLGVRLPGLEWTLIPVRVF